MTAYLLDTNVVSALRAPNRQPEEFQHWAQGVNGAQCFVSVLTWLEIAAGVDKKARVDPAQGELLAGWFRVVHAAFERRTVAFGDAEAAASAPVLGMRTRGLIDVLLAGTALAQGMTFVTRNVADFADVPGLAVLNPWG